MKITIYPSIDSDRFSRLQLIDERLLIANCDTPKNAISEIEDSDAFLGKISPDMLASATRLQWVQSFTASLEHYLFPELVSHPCILTNMRGLFSDVIADQVIGYIVCFARNLHIYIRNQMSAYWEPCGGESGRVNFAAGPGVVNPIDRQHQQLSDQVLGIVGFGEIGKEIARRASAFGMRILAVDPIPQVKPEYVESIKSITSLDSLLAQSDYVVIAAPHTPQTKGMFHLDVLRKMKSDGYLINIGRGAIVVLNDLVSALETKMIAGTALDVFETEPLPKEHPLWKFPNVIITPHIAGYSPKIAERHFRVIAENVQRFMEGKPLINVVNKEMWF
jgi:phosphoglycerate dehydrogenase-like enzyme